MAARSGHSTAAFQGSALVALVLVLLVPGAALAVPPGDIPVTMAVEPGEAISPEQARAPAFLVDRHDQLIVVDQVRGFLLGRFLMPPGLAPDSPAYPGGVGLEFQNLEGPPLPPIPLTPLHLQYGFPFMAEGSLAGGPCIADLDRDGRCEIILATTEGTVHLLSHDGECCDGWPLRLDDGFYAPPSAGDLDGDGLEEIVLGGISGRIYAWRVDGSPAAGWPVRPSVPTPDGPAAVDFFCAAALADVDGDGAHEVCIAAVQGVVWMLRGNGEILPGWPQVLPSAVNPPNPASVFSSPACADLDGDGAPEILLATNAYQVHAWKISGERCAGWPAWIPHRARAGFGGLAIGDVNGDRQPEVIVTSEHGFMGPATVSVFDAHGALLPGWPYDLPEPCNAGAALGDLTGDGTAEIVVATIGGNAAIVALDGRTARPLPGWPLRLKRETVNASPLIADLDGDGWNDIMVAALSTGLESDAWLWAIDRLGNQLRGFPIMLPQDEIVRASPAAADLDGDGDLELLAATERLNSLYAWDLDALCDPFLLPWPGAWGGPSRCSRLEPGNGPCATGVPGITAMPKAEALAGDDAAHGQNGAEEEPRGPDREARPQDPALSSPLDLWPPTGEPGGPSGAAGSLSTISFELREETQVRLVIFDIKHAPVRRLLQHALPPGHYSIFWDGKDDTGASQPAGIYFYQLGLGDRARTRQLLLLK